MQAEAVVDLMSLTRPKQAIMDERRTLVARARLHGLTVREIVAGLAKEGRVNEATGRPWSHGTIIYDLKAIHRQWREQAQKDIGEHIARQIAERTEVRREAWKDRDFTSVLKSLQQEAHLLGTDAPEKIEQSGAIRIEFVDVDNNTSGMAEVTSKAK